MASHLTAQDVATTFVKRYYTVLNKSPDKIHLFYDPRSKVGRARHGHPMIEASPVDAICDNSLSIGDGGTADIKTIDAQYTVDDDGVIVAVSGYFLSLSPDRVLRRRFSQTFFLARGTNGYYVRNDIFRYDDADDNNQHDHRSTSGTARSQEQKKLTPAKQHIQEQENQYVQNQQLLLKDAQDVSEAAVSVPSQNAVGSTAPVDTREPPMVELIRPAPTTPVKPVAETIALHTSESSLPSAVQGDAPRKTFASIAKGLTENLGPFPVLVNTQPAPHPSRLPAPSKLLTPSKPKLPKIGENRHQEVDSNSIVLKNLPSETTPEQLEEEFKIFGPVKPGGIHVKGHPEQGYCFAFLEFEDRSSVEGVIADPPLKIGGRRIYIEEKLPQEKRQLDVRGNGSVSWRSGKEDFSRGGSGRVNSSSSYTGSGKSRSNAPRKCSS